MNINQLRKWTGLNQEQFAAKIGIARAALTKIETGGACASTRLIDSIINTYSPHVLFIAHHPSTPAIALGMIVAEQMDMIEHEPDAFNAALKQSQRIIVITNDKAPFLELIDKALEESGLPHIPTRGIKIGEDGTVEPWND
jgi:DNA-binding XRE family transcriptional regulator